jgi:flagellar assembly protein FliH
MTLPFEISTLDETTGVLPLEFMCFDAIPEDNEQEGRSEEEALRLRVDDLERELSAQKEASVGEIDRVRRAAASESAAAAAEAKVRLDEERARVVRLADQFQEDRSRYFVEIEREVVSLALAIARRVLHREVTLDPLLLRGIVRVALEKIDAESTVTLRVSEEEVEAWQTIMLTNERPALLVRGDGQLAVGEMLLETTSGQLNLGIAEQLIEIERGLFDLVEKRPHR